MPSPSASKYLFDAQLKPVLPLCDIPLVRADNQSLMGYGHLVDDPGSCDVEIVRWPARGWRPVDLDSGDEAGTVEGEFSCDWQGNVLMGHNSAVDGHYVLGWNNNDPTLDTPAATRQDHVWLWHMNYHPDGGQLFFPLDGKPFVAPLALPGDDLQLDKIVAFWFDGSQGLYIHPNIWHEGVFPAAGHPQRFLDRQGRVHARVSADMATEFGVYLRVPLPAVYPY